MHQTKDEAADLSLLQGISTLLDCFPGSDEVTLIVSQTEKTTKLRMPQKVDSTNKELSELLREVEPGNILIAKENE